MVAACSRDELTEWTEINFLLGASVTFILRFILHISHARHDTDQ